MGHIVAGKAYANNEAALIAWSLDAPIPNCLGFEITRIYTRSACWQPGSPSKDRRLLDALTRRPAEWLTTNEGSLIFRIVYFRLFSAYFLLHFAGHNGTCIKGVGVFHKQMARGEGDRGQIIERIPVDNRATSRRV